MIDGQLQELFKSEVTRLPETRRGSAYHSTSSSRLTTSQVQNHEKVQPFQLELRKALESRFGPNLNSPCNKDPLCNSGAESQWIVTVHHPSFFTTRENENRETEAALDALEKAMLPATLAERERRPTCGDWLDDHGGKCAL